MVITATGVSVVLLSLVYSVAGNCLVGSCGAGMCCSAYGFCGSGTQYCGAGAGAGAGAGVVAVAADCRTVGCPAGQCCSPYGYCGTTAQHCGGGGTGGGAVVANPGGGLCSATGCPAGSCCSSHGYCGTTAAHCGGVAYSGCGYSGCGAGLCCSQYGYCGAYATHCALANLLSRKQPASLEGEFQGEATYYNETKAGSDYTTCGTNRARSLNEDGQEKIYTAALNELQFDPYTVNGIPSTNPVCHKKAIVTGVKGEIVVQFLDRCHDCKQGDIALNYDGFLAVAGELGNGHTDIAWHFL